jgi:predicted methyltransferase MtxX (methanogen marker protein 4)
VLALKHDELKKEFSEFREEFELMKRERSLSIVSSSINVFTNRVLLWPLGIDEAKKVDYFFSLRSDATARAKATELLSKSGVGITVDQLLQFRRTICLLRNDIQHGIADPQDFATAFGDVGNLVDGDKVLLTKLHLLEFNYMYRAY